MEFTFGIITGGEKNHREALSNKEVIARIKKIIETIESQKISKYEIIIVGGLNDYQDFNYVKHFEFTEKGNPWITRKKNIITQNASFENVVYMHDYYSLDKDWYSSMLAYGNNFKILMNQILDINNNRYHDWEIVDFFEPGVSLLPYEVKDLTKFQYINGGFWIAKKNVMLEFPLNETLGWGSGEDLEWSSRVKTRYCFELNEKAKIRLLKPRFIGSERKVLTEEQVNFLRQRL